jgi:hypothetical protein
MQHGAPLQSPADRARSALLSKFHGKLDSRGYVTAPEGNLIHGVELRHFAEDLSRGDGQELRSKFLAVHSSCALAVNTFAVFKDRPGDLVIDGRQGAERVTFEKTLRIFPNRRPANLDVWIDFPDTAVAVESKLLEYFGPKPAVFAPAYDQLAPQLSDRPWWIAFQAAKGGPRQHLDRAQLLKHYFGIRRLQESGTAPARLILLYLFWEPMNAADISECRRHREEIDKFATCVADASVEFRWMTYPDLWREWSEVPSLREHARRLHDRYAVAI